MAKQRLDVSVVICTYSPERESQLLRAVESLQSQVAQPREIVVVVDQNEGLIRSLRPVLSPDVRLIYNTGPFGLSGARNTGVRIARGEIVAFLDDDAWAEPDWLTFLANAFGERDVVGVGGCITPEWSNGRRPSWLPKELDWVVACSYVGLPMASDHRIRNVIGCNMAFRRTLFEEVGYFRSSLGRLGKVSGQAEETDLCLRIFRAFPTASIVYEPRAIVHHAVAANRMTLTFLVTRSYGEGYWKGQLQRLQDGELNGGLSSESLYLKYLITRFVPNRLSHFCRAQSLMQLSITLLSIVAVGIGYLVAKLSLLDPTARLHVHSVYEDENPNHNGL